MESNSLNEQEFCVKAYRMIQLIEKSMNAYLMERIVPTLVCTIPTLQIITQYVCITMHGEIAMPVFLIFPLILVDAIACNGLVFTLASWVFNASTKSLKELDTTTSQHVRKSVLRRQLKSCGVLNIKFGSNYIDSGTPLVIQNFCSSQTVSLMLVMSGRRDARKY